MRQCFALRMLELQDFRHTSAANYYRALRLISEHFDCDPAELSEEDLRSYFVFVPECSQVGCEELPSASGGGKRRFIGDAWQGL